MLTRKERRLRERERVNAVHVHYIQIRETLAKWQNWRCFYCTKKMIWKTVTYDHIQTKASGGDVSLENGVAACRECNWLRGDMPFHEFCEDQGITMKRPRHKADRFKYLCELVD